MLAAIFRLTSKEDFSRVKAKGKNFHSKNFTLSVCKSPNNKNIRFGIVMPNKVFPLAVDRNRIKRMLYESTRFQLSHLSSEFDCVFLPKTSILSAYASDVMNEVKVAFEKTHISK